MDAVEEADADLKDVADDTSLRLVLNPVPMIEAPIDAGVLVVNEPVFDDDKWLLEPAALGLELSTFILSLSV